MPAPDDTRVCPFCAETIKAAAVKCRYCHSDLPEPVEVPPSPPAPSQPVPVPLTAATSSAMAPVAVAAAPVRLRISGRTRTIATAASLLLTLALLGLAVAQWREESRLTSSASAGRAARAVVVDEVESLLSYDYKTFDDDLSAAEDLMTPSFAKKYAPTVAEIRDRALSQKRTQTADVVAVSVVSQSPDRVTTLVFVDTVSVAVGSKTRNVLQNRVTVTLVRRDGTWLVDDLSVPSS